MQTGPFRLVSVRRMLGQFLKFDNKRFLPHDCQLTVPHYHTLMTSAQPTTTLPLPAMTVSSGQCGISLHWPQLQHMLTVLVTSTAVLAGASELRRSISRSPEQLSGQRATQPTVLTYSRTCEST
jgi:hypothetical protein